MFYIGYEPDVGGIGDFIYILFGAFCWCKKYNIAMGICIPAHPLNKCINCITEEPATARIIRCITTTNVSCTLTDEIARHRGCAAAADVVVYSNMNDYLHIYLEYMNPSLKYVLLEEFRRDVLKYTDFIETHIIQNYLSHTEYFAIHLRCGDGFLRGGGGGGGGENRVKSLDIEQRIEDSATYLSGAQNESTPGAPIYFFCDNETIREHYAQKYGFLYFPTKIIHIADAADASAAAAAAVIDSFCEFVILGRAKCVVALTKSNFSYVSSLIGGAEYVYMR